jgi:hypothetical protein
VLWLGKTGAGGERGGRRVRAELSERPLRLPESTVKVKADSGGRNASKRAVMNLRCFAVCLCLVLLSCGDVIDSLSDEDMSRHARAYEKLAVISPHVEVERAKSNAAVSMRVAGA